MNGMDTKFKSSFIPKTAFEESGLKREGFGFFGVLVVLVFIVSLVVSGGAFFYKMMLKSDIGNLKSQVSSALAAIDKKSVNEIVLFDKQLDSVREVLSRHVAVSQFFEMLEKDSVSQIQFMNLNFSAYPGSNITVSMDGKARSYSAIALQEDVFIKNTDPVSVNFNNMKADPKSGEVSFSFKGEFKNKLIKFGLPELTI